MESRRRLLDDLAKIATSAAGIVQGTSREVEQLVRQRCERLLDSFDLVTRDEFEVVKAMAEAARLENEALAARLEALEKQRRRPERPAARKSPANAKSGAARKRTASKK